MVVIEQYQTSYLAWAVRSRSLADGTCAYSFHRLEKQMDMLHTHIQLLELLLEDKHVACLSKTPDSSTALSKHLNLYRPRIRLGVASVFSLVLTRNTIRHIHYGRGRNMCMNDIQKHGLDKSLGSTYHVYMYASAERNRTNGFRSPY